MNPSPWVIKLAPFLCCLPLAVPFAAQQTADRKGTIERVEIKGATFAAPVLSRQEEKELRNQLRQETDVPIQITSSDNSPVTILEAKVRGVKRAQTGAVPLNDYAVRINLSFKNNTKKQIRELGFEFKNTDAGHTFYLYRTYFDQRGLPPHEDREFVIDLMTVSGNPGSLAVKIAGVQFENGVIWGSFPFPPALEMSAPLPSDIEVDTKPRPLTYQGPRYTDAARAHRIMGTVGLQVEIGTDGSVQDVRVINALPDGLTEEAIRVTRLVKFSPAMKNGKPVNYWMKMSVEFNIKQD